MSRRSQTAALALALLAVSAGPLAAQRELAGEARIRLALERLNVLGSVLMIAAHPDDENTALLAYFARGRKLRTAYLSLTRGEGGQNLIGSEQGDLLGVVRTQELLAARKIDGAEQYFTRAIDFGYSKSAGETLTKWGREEILGDIVWIIRRLRPDVVILRFSGTARDGHGQHQASAILGKEAFAAAADPARFPEQLAEVRPWRAKRLFWNVFSFRGGRFTDTGDMPGRIDLDAGDYSPILGFSYAEIAGMSRSMHRSQGFGAPEIRGPAPNSLLLLAGDPAKEDPFEGIDTSWNRVAGGERAGELLREAARNYRPERPEETVPLLIKARGVIRQLDDPWAKLKLEELDETIALLTGLWLDATAARYFLVPGEAVQIEAVALNRSRYPLELAGLEIDGAGKSEQAAALAYNQPVRRAFTWTVPHNTPYTHPYWLRRPKYDESRYELDDMRQIGQADSDPLLWARFRLKAGGEQIVLRRPVEHRYVDRVRGELTRPLAVVPPVAVALAREAIVAPDGGPRTVAVELAAHAPAAGELRLELPDGWRASPARQPFRLGAPGEQATLRFELAPPEKPSRGAVTAVATAGGVEIASGTTLIDHPHIPPQTLALPARAALVRVDARTLARKVGYVMGAGDKVPAALEQLGCQVTLLEAEDLARGDLAIYDAIVTGVRAYNVRPDLRANQQRLLHYVEQGGTLIVQYNVLDRPVPGAPDPLARLGPYPLRVGRERVSVEEAPVEFLRPGHPLLQAPNAITPADFDGWVQERGLYFAQEWDARYEPLWAMADPGEKPLAGGTLFARYGKGAYIFTALSWFRQLPAGVPGAYRIFANFLSAGKVAP
jgi:LmbE family N-acetylglucosaminyl deacetylase